MLSKTDRKYFATWRDVCRVRGWKSDNDSIRYAFHRSIDVPESHLQFTLAHWDRVFPQLKLLLDPDNLNAALKVVSYLNHDAAQAAHVPVVAPGKPRRKNAAPRRWASRYERITDVDDPGERKRLRYVIERLFEPRLIDAICRDRWERSDWQDLPLPQLTELRDLLKARLSKFITKVKQGKVTYDFPFSIITNTETGLYYSNAWIIATLLHRGVPVRMHPDRVGAAFTRPLRRHKTREVVDEPITAELALAGVAAGVSPADQDPF